MTKIYMNQDEQNATKAKGRMFKALKEARALAKKWGDEYEAVRVHDSYFRDQFIAYTVEHK